MPPREGAAGQRVAEGAHTLGLEGGPLSVVGVVGRVVLHRAQQVWLAVRVVRPSESQAQIAGDSVVMAAAAR